MDQHFIPQFYLRGFCDPIFRPEQEPWIWVADFQEGSVERRAPRNVGKKANYYAFPEFDRAADETIEELFSKIESTAAPILRKMLRGELELTDQERADLLFFVAFFVTRVPFFRNLLEEAAGKLGKMVLQLSASGPEHFERTLQKATEGQEALTPQRMEEIRQWVLDGKNYTVRGLPVLSLGLGFQLAYETIYPIFDDMTWALLRPAGQGYFVSSDSPVSWIDPTPRPAFLRGHGLAMRSVEVTFPLFPRLCLLGTWGQGGGVRDVSDAVVTELNRRRVAFADRYAFADRTEGAHLALRLRREVEVGRG